MKLVFVYKSSSGKLKAIWDSAHKLFSPATYPCSLCALTFGIFSERNVWKEFRKRTSVEMVFLHQNEFNKQYPNELHRKVQFPIIYKEVNDALATFISSETLQNFKKTEDLISAIEARLLRH
ncbi:MAG: GTPase [Flavobacteriaceae bacterium]